MGLTADPVTRGWSRDQRGLGGRTACSTGSRGSQNSRLSVEPAPRGQKEVLALSRLRHSLHVLWVAVGRAEESEELQGQQSCCEVSAGNSFLAWTLDSVEYLVI